MEEKRVTFLTKERGMWLNRTNVTRVVNETTAPHWSTRKVTAGPKAWMESNTGPSASILSRQYTQWGKLIPHISNFVSQLAHPTYEPLGDSSKISSDVLQFWVRMLVVRNPQRVIGPHIRVECVFQFRPVPLTTPLTATLAENDTLNDCYFGN